LLFILATPMAQDDLGRASQDLVEVGLALVRETDLPSVLERVVTESRRLTGAEAGTLYLLEGDRLQFSEVQNDVLASRLGVEEMRRCLQAEPLRLDEASLAGHVARTGDILNLHDPHMIPPDRPYRFNPDVDDRCHYRTRSLLVVPLYDPSGTVLGVLQLINARDRGGQVVPFDSRHEPIIRTLALQAAVAIRNTRLEALALKDALTEAYNRRYFLARVREECLRHARTSEPLALVLVNLDRFRGIDDAAGQARGDAALREVARLLLRHSRAFTVVSRLGGDEFAVLLVGTSKSGALTYAQRIRTIIEGHPFDEGRITASLGVAAVPGDATAPDELLRVAHEAVRQAKRRGRNQVVGA
jgi:diguanylate cyclase (GGDEF)-like protein